MTEDGPVSGWESKAIAFLSDNLPTRDGPGTGWDHQFVSAYEMSCEALVALGQAEKTKWGAVPVPQPRLPDPLPRWDDICVAVLGLAVQSGGLQFRLPDGTRPRSNSVTVIIGPTDRETPPPPCAPNIVGGIGLAYAKPGTLSVLETLGLIADGRWTAVAETILWREAPAEWEIDFRTDSRFVTAFELAIKSLPDDVGAEMDQLASITDEDVDAEIARAKTWLEEARKEYGPHAKLRASTTPEAVRRGLEFSRRHGFDWLFFRRWRLADGWLTPSESKRALEIFHDPLAISMRKAVVRELYPGLPFLYEN